MKQKDYDKLLSIDTEGDQKGFNKSLHYHRYEATPYHALEELLKVYELNSSDRVVDFGCGKGRLLFLLNYLSNAAVVGVEMNETLYQKADENRDKYLNKYIKHKDKIHLYCCVAEEYRIDPSDNRFYFFNPFSIQVFMNIINNILLSVEESGREVDLVLYYPSEDYIYFLETQTSFELKKEVILPGLYDHNADERFLIYRLAYASGIAD